MGKILRETRFKDRTPEWYAYKETCLGASSMGVVLNLSEYNTTAELFQTKAGFLNDKSKNTKFTHFGIEMENIIASRYWQYYGPSDVDALYENAKHGKIIRTCRNHVGFTWDEDYPWIKSNLDRVMGRDAFNLITGELVEPRTPLEIKTIHPFVLKKYNNAPPPSYIIQVQTQMICSGATYSELAALSDRDFFVFPIPKNESVCAHIIEAGRVFMELVAEGKKLKKEYDIAMLNGNYDLADSIMQRVDEITPVQQPGQETPYKDFLEKRYKDEDRRPSQKMGTSALLHVTKEHQYLKEIETHLKNAILFRRNEIERYMGDIQHLVFEGTDIRVAHGKQFRVYGELDYKQDANDVISTVLSKEI